MVMVGGVQCPDCGPNSKWFKTTRDLRTHSAHVHGTRCTSNRKSTITISLDEAVLRALDAAAGGGERSAFVECAIKRALEARV